MIGKLLDHRYQVIRVLAIGGFGQTYIAQDTRRPGNPTCVVKHLKPASSDPRVFETAKRLFNSEAETLENLGHHDQIPRLLAYFDENQEFYLVQEFIDGHTLTEELILGNRWSESQVIHLLQEVLGILEFVHHQRVIHRDIKPDNIIRRTADNKLVLVDFGAVKQLRTQMVTVGGQPTATVAIGTPGYMPTEQGQGKPRPNSDIYALGIIAIQALTGISPTQLQEDPQTGELIWRHLVNVSDGLAVVLNKMVRYHFKDRYQTATEALQALQNAINPVEIAVSSTSPKSLNHSHYQLTKPSSPVSRQQTVAVAPVNQVVSQPVHKDSHKPDPLPLLIGIVLAGGAAALVANIYPDVKNLAANVLSNNSTANKCLATVASNSNIRSEPSSINTDTVLQTIGVNTNFEATGKRTKRGWVEIKLNSGRLAWAHSDVIVNNPQWTSCLRDQGTAIKIIDDSTLIAARPVPKLKPKSDTFINPEPENSPKPVQPQENSPKIVEQARRKYESGDLVGAIAMLRSIPGNASAGIRETTAIINQWQQDWQKADALFNDINKALEDGQWDTVLEYKNNPEKLPNIKYWRDKLDPVFKQAAENVAKQALPKTDNQGEQNIFPEEIPDIKEESTQETPSSEVED
ncbi:serine/threonine protein kinase [Anabaena subtropica]|uniref:non-specific serine/threonine protein kinase n=1 Tax=Anabaena subtropica FACHB-260 TaxID=2692884 RepID=A0ABR8CRY3_9NOST|nr:serine/threonine protein kinase [Anabaena subtropica]MBD2345551.1 protein kinase [Anabaena subtropica FACHB-260]